MRYSLPLQLKIALIFFTNDIRLKSVLEIEVLTISELI